MLYEFYSQDSIRLGDTSTLEQMIHKKRKFLSELLEEEI
jgi:hypothetical protein